MCKAKHANHDVHIVTRIHPVACGLHIMAPINQYTHNAPEVTRRMRVQPRILEPSSSAPIIAVTMMTKQYVLLNHA